MRHFVGAAALVTALASIASAQPAAPPSAEAPAPPAAMDTWGSGASSPPAPRPLPEQLPPPRRRPDRDERARDSPADKHDLRYALEGIEVRGNSRTRSRVVLRYVPFQQGDVIRVDDPEIELLRYRLLGTGFFRDVQLSLRKGSRRGSVVLVIDVVERNTIVVTDLWMGLSADADTRGNARPLTAYAGVDIAETNLAGSGVTLGSAIGLAQDQLALRVRFLDPAFLGSRWMTSGQLLFNDAKDFFGNADVLWDDPLQLEEVPDYAVVRYKRFGGNLGIGRDLSVATQLWLHYRLEGLDTDLPRAATHTRGLDREPILFDIQSGRSVLSTARATLQLDTRDSPFLPTRGWYTSVTGELGLAPFGSDYGFQRIDVHASRWWALPWQHVVRLELFGGAIAGDAPFFEQYYVGDFSDFLPGRVLGLNFDRRPSPNFLDTAIVEVRYGHYAAKLGGEYRIPLFRGQRSVYGIDLFGSAGLFAVAHRRDLTDPARGYSRLQLAPLDLTANVGFRMDTSAGGFSFAFSNVLSFVPLRREGGP
ncbi:MAG: BamA/TamA family outer membrane protein [Polyangiaceae bacterium]|nr:BamA/TamA family outer membrane protein [Polyangiaceae bacterium]